MLRPRRGGVRRIAASQCPRLLSMPGGVVDALELLSLTATKQLHKRIFWRSMAF